MYPYAIHTQKERCCSPSALTATTAEFTWTGLMWPMVPGTSEREGTDGHVVGPWLTEDASPHRVASMALPQCLTLTQATF